jgi:hypothetical protein
VRTAKFFVATFFSFGMTLLLVNSSEAHSVFKKEMAKKFPDMKVSCNACHVKGEKKTTRSSLGKLFSKELGVKDMSKTWGEKKGAEKKDYEATVMVPAFQKALTKIVAMPVEDFLKAGAISGIDDPDAEEEGGDAKAEE